MNKKEVLFYYETFPGMRNLFEGLRFEGVAVAQNNPGEIYPQPCRPTNITHKILKKVARERDNKNRSPGKC